MPRPTRRAVLGAGIALAGSDLSVAAERPGTTPLGAGNAPAAEPARHVASTRRPETRTGRRPLGRGETELVPFADALPVPPVLRPGGTEELDIVLKAVTVRLHAQLPPTRVWTYDGHLPGPTIEVRSGRSVRVTWSNELSGAHPVTAVEVPPGAPGELSPVDLPGRGGARPLTGVAELAPWTVTHLHGGRTSGGSDGWPENGLGPGEGQTSEYANDHRAATWWYHDHAMDITRWNVFAGLAGMYLVRDEEEDALRLPSGEREIPLIIQDRNLDTDSEGGLTGRLLHKTLIGETDSHGRNATFPFFGPYTLVNGKIWPYAEVDARWYRFRLLNASNSRTYHLRFMDEESGRTVAEAVHQIGSDAGLLPVPIPVDGTLSVAPAERMDLLIDFGRLRGRTVRVVNAASGVRYPQVMQFRVSHEPVADGFVLPEVLASSFARVALEELPRYEKRLVVLTPPGPIGAGHAEMWEMHQIPAGGVPIPGEGIIQIRGADGELRTYRRGARSFDDALGYLAERDGWEQWSFLNLGGAGMHPMHIHLMDFQVLGYDLYSLTAPSPYDDGIGGTTAPLECTGQAPVAPGNQGWKDVVQVAPGQMVHVIGQFRGATGRFVYHCHMLEHEDTGMMRPFVVMPRDVLKFHHHRPGTGSGHIGH
ncbi:multicopper oxidase family protein [Streptomyces sp. GMR22]|uniref:multicopper oxidase family protein n=1 Tax=Streptomyces sp. GMR22 TaxID=2759524 RepID=UPI0015F89060|nr:multicopper oxidase domain-containing protein [Streptomyces sp. GMR22]MBA6437031.1 multicopper oxidase domain-containing protein [Streptomyces sp. GMR22]